MYIERRGPGLGLAVVSLTGYMASSYEGQYLGRALHELARDTSVKAVCLKIDSAGGDAVGFDGVAEAAAALRAAKPLSALVCSSALSLGYMLASFAQEIVGTPTCVVGSIGVMFSPLVDTTGANDKAGVKVHAPTTGTHKLAGVLGTPQTPEMVANLTHAADMIAQPFFESVSRATGLSVAAIKALDGAIFVGQDAVDKGLVRRLVAPETYLQELESRLSLASTTSTPSAFLPSPMAQAASATASTPQGTPMSAPIIPAAPTAPTPPTATPTPTAPTASAAIAVLAAMSAAQLAEAFAVVDAKARAAIAEASAPPASIAELKAAFKDAEFVLSAAERGLTMPKALAEFASKTHTAPTAAAATHPLAMPKPQGAPPKPAANAPTEASDQTPASYEAACVALASSGKSRQEAMRLAAVTYPDLHEDYVGRVRSSRKAVPIFS